MSQEFHGGVGQVAEGNINNYGISINVADKTEARLLVPAQKSELHDLRAKCEELGADPRAVWREVHAHLSVKSLNEITAAQFQEARSVMQARLEQLQEVSDKNRLVWNISRTATEKGATGELDNYCDLTFGRTQLNNLKRAELQKVLEFIQGFEPAAIQPIAPTAEALPLQQFLLTYRWNAAGLFLLGLLVGHLWL